jgi:hypothetical protein
MLHRSGTAAAAELIVMRGLVIVGVTGRIVGRPATRACAAAKSLAITWSRLIASTAFPFATGR